jgi:hypothetical protein
MSIFEGRHTQFIEVFWDYVDNLLSVLIVSR